MDEDLSPLRPGQTVVLVAAVRHARWMREFEWRLAAQGVLVWPVTIAPQDDPDGAIAARICATHRARIDRADAVLVLDPDGPDALGPDSRATVLHARAAGVATYELSALAETPRYSAVWRAWRAAAAVFLAAVNAP